ncbi:MAG: hypothetical protein K2L00_10655, partial [Muribaculaceae bacterium]|nr:hypothetical protein [Muribaculaceae bacterium]
VENCQNLAFVDLQYNNLSTVMLSNFNQLQRVNVAQNPQLVTLDVSFDSILRFVNVSGDTMLTDFRTMASPQLHQILGVWSNYI